MYETDDAKCKNIYPQETIQCGNIATVRIGDELVCNSCQWQNRFEGLDKSIYVTNSDILFFIKQYKDPGYAKYNQGLGEIGLSEWVCEKPERERAARLVSAGLVTHIKSEVADPFLWHFKATDKGTRLVVAALNAARNVIENT
jgi:hypothetical protein